MSELEIMIYKELHRLFPGNPLNNEIIAKAIDLIVHVELFMDGVRRVTSVAERDRLKALLAECATEIQADLDHEYKNADGDFYHPSYERRYNRDMDIVNRARAELKHTKP